MDLIHLTGYLSGFIIAIALIPQVYQSWKTKSTKDISLLWSLILLSGILLYFVYGIGLKEMPMIVTNSIETLLLISLIIAKLIYK